MVLDTSSPVPVEQPARKPKKWAKRLAVWTGFVITSAILVNGMVLLVLMVPKEQTANRIWVSLGAGFLTLVTLGVNFLIWKLTGELWTE